jgi:hypothetical protein
MTGDVECSSGLAYRSAYHKAISVIDKAIRIDKMVMPPPTNNGGGTRWPTQFTVQIRMSIIVVLFLPSYFEEAGSQLILKTLSLKGHDKASHVFMIAPTDHHLHRPPGFPSQLWRTSIPTDTFSQFYL